MIYRIIIFLALLQIPLKGNCQSSTKLSFKKWMIGASYEGGLADHRLAYSSSNRWIQEIRDSREIPKYGFTTGINFWYPISRAVSLETGVLFASRGFQSRSEELDWAAQGQNYPVKSKTAVSYQYIEIPFRVNYSFRIKKPELYATSGFSLNNFTSKNTRLTSYFANGDRKKIRNQVNYGYRQTTTSFLVGLGMNARLSERLIFNIEPMYRQNLTSIVSDDQSGEYPHSIGLNTRLFLKLKKRAKR